jgi:hypothetical protein
MFAILEKAGGVILFLAIMGLGFYMRFQSAVDFEERRQRKSGLQGFLKKID